MPFGNSPQDLACYCYLTCHRYRIINILAEAGRVAARFSHRRSLVYVPQNWDGAVIYWTWLARIGSHLWYRHSIRMPPDTPVSAPPTPYESPPAVEQNRWFAQEIHPHDSVLRAYLRKQFPYLRDLDDVVQESYLQVLHRRQARGELGLTKAYLFTVARNVALKIIRKRRIFSPVPVNETLASQPLEQESDFTENADASHKDRVFAEAIASLPECCREIVKLRAVHGLSYAEIAERRAISEATVRVQIARGIRKCAEFFRERER